MIWFFAYIFYNNFVNNQLFNLKLNDYISKCCSIDSKLKVMKYLLLGYLKM